MNNLIKTDQGDKKICRFSTKSLFKSFNVVSLFIAGIVDFLLPTFWFPMMFICGFTDLKPELFQTWNFWKKMSNKEFSKKDLQVNYETNILFCSLV